LYELVRQAAPQGTAAQIAASSSSWTYVPVLMYHYIRINPDPHDRLGFNLSVTPAMFRAQLDYLAQNGFNVLSLHQAVEAIRLHRALPSRPVVLTFDDGYADFYATAVPELRAHGFTATEFVATGLVGRSGYMTWPQIRSAETMGFTMGAHTVNHVALAGVAPARALWEMRQSKLTLEAMLGHPILDFAYPYGSFNASVAANARQLGFECAVSTVPGTRHWGATLMALYRVRIGGGTSLATFAQLVG
jgi:peptidoglycan/xylan/chitin deacetylase (PgdA/CDA1 family)